MGVHAKLLAAQQEIAGIDKTGHNTHFDYDFFEEREVLRVAKSALTNAGLAFFYSVEEVTDREVQTKRGNQELLTDVRMVCTLFDAESGDSISGGAIGRGQDGQDKGINKAIVAGLKYWLLKVLMIPTGDDTESDANTADGNVPPEKTTAASKKPTEKPAKEPSKKPPADTEKKRVATRLKKLLAGGAMLPAVGLKKCHASYAEGNVDSMKRAIAWIKEQQ